MNIIFIYREPLTNGVKYEKTVAWDVIISSDFRLCRV